jgi:hypothetical protein
MNSDWNACDAHARYVEPGTGRETVVICTLEKHAAPFDTSIEHYDGRLDIRWYYGDEEIRFDDEPAGEPE